MYGNKKKEISKLSWMGDIVLFGSLNRRQYYSSTLNLNLIAMINPQVFIMVLSYVNKQKMYK